MSEILERLGEGQVNADMRCSCVLEDDHNWSSNQGVAQIVMQKKRVRCATRFSCPGWDSNPHALTDTWPSTMPVYQFQHLGGARLDAPL